MIKNLQVAADVGFELSMLSAIAIRGERLVLARVRAAGRDPEAIQNDALNVVEIDADERIVAAVMFDLEDFDAAIAELDARYLAGEAAAHAHTWSVIAGSYAALNRHELPPTTPDWVNIDHRRETAFGPGDVTAYIHAGWDLGQDIRIYIEAVHRLSNLGAVITYAAHGTSHEGFDAEWRASPLHGRRRHGQPLRTLRRGRPRRRAREIRSAQPAGTAAGKRGKPSVRAHLWRTSQPATGTRWRR